MLTPSIFGRSFFDELNDFGNFEPTIRNHMPDFRKMSTDVKETEDEYEIDMELPGFKKSEVSAQLKDGYLTVIAEHKEDAKDEKKDKKFIRQERYYGRYQRNFFIGEGIDEEDVSAKFEDGILKLQVPKREEKPKEDEKKIIRIQ